MKLQKIGPGPLSRATKKAMAECGNLLDTVWDPPASERLVLDVLPALRRSIDAERSTGTSLSEMVRTRRFTERVSREVLGVTSALLDSPPSSQPPGPETGHDYDQSV